MRKSGEPDLRVPPLAPLAHGSRRAPFGRAPHHEGVGWGGRRCTACSRGANRLCLWLSLSLVFALSFGALAAARADDYPDRPITLVVPFPPGGTNNIMARAVADKLSESLGQQVVVENRSGGAAGTIATRQFAKSAPDGYTLLLAYTSNLASGPNLFRDVGYDPRKDLAPVGLVASASAILVAHPSLPAQNVAELIALMRKTGPSFQFSSPGVGTVNHLATELFAQKAGVKFTHIPYKSSGGAMTDLLGGHVLVQFTPIPVARGPVESGAIRALGVTGLKRSVLMPDVPTIAESGLPGYEVVAALRHRGAGRHAARDHRQAQQAARRGARDRRGEETPLQCGRRAGRGHAGGLRRRHRSRGEDVGRADHIRRVEGEPMKVRATLLAVALIAADIDREEAKWSEVVRRSGAKAN